MKFGSPYNTLCFPTFGPICRVVLVLALILAGSQALAADDEPRTFMGETITGKAGPYLVKNDVNVREKPSTKAKKVGRFDEGTRVSVLGRVGKDWLAVEDGGKDLGFVYAPVLTPLIDAALDEPIRGMTMGPGRNPCEYIVRFEGREEVDARDPMLVANYEVGWRCNLRKQREKVTIVGYMFLTESPYDGGRRPLYQLSIDLPGYGDEPDQVFSTIMIYDADKDIIRYDGVSLPKMAKRPTEEERPAPSVTRALTRAMELAPETWGDDLWTLLIGAN